MRDWMFNLFLVVLTMALLGIVAGFVIGILLVLIMNYLHKKIHEENNNEAYV